MCRRSSMIGRFSSARSTRVASAPDLARRSTTKRAARIDWRPRRTEPATTGMRSGAVIEPSA